MCPCRDKFLFHNRVQNNQLRGWKSKQHSLKSSTLQFYPYRTKGAKKNVANTT